MQDRGWLEEEGRARGLDLTVEWATFTGGPPINDALISGNIDLAAGGVGPMLTIWKQDAGEPEGARAGGAGLHADVAE